MGWVAMAENDPALEPIRQSADFRDLMHEFLVRREMSE